MSYKNLDGSGGIPENLLGIPPHAPLFPIRMIKQPFVTLVFRGKRFDEAAMPLEALPELAAYRELVVSVAKELYTSRNPGRKRLPKGFDASFRLVVDRVDTGSVVPNISRIIGASALLLPGMLSLSPPSIDLFDEARVIVQEAIAACATDSPMPAELKPDSFARFNPFGRTLRADESVVVAAPGVREGAVYNKDTRRKLLLRAQSTYEDEVDLIGEVRAADKDAGGFILRTLDGAKIDVRAVPLFLPRAVRSLDDSTLVRVRGTGVFDGEGRLLKVTTTTDVSLAEEGDDPAARQSCALGIEAQVDSLKGLADGWFDGDGKSYEAVSLAWLADLLTGLLDGFQLPTPYVYPTPEGHARAEWPGRDWEIVANFDLTSKSAEIIAARLDSDELHERNMALTTPGAESHLGRFLVDHLN